MVICQQKESPYPSPQLETQRVSKLFFIASQFRSIRLTQHYLGSARQTISEQFRTKSRSRSHSNRFLIAFLKRIALHRQLYAPEQRSAGQSSITQKARNGLPVVFLKPSTA